MTKVLGPKQTPPPKASAGDSVLIRGLCPGKLKDCYCISRIINSAFIWDTRQVSIYQETDLVRWNFAYQDLSQSILIDQLTKGILFLLTGTACISSKTSPMLSQKIPSLSHHFASLCLTKDSIDNLIPSKPFYLQSGLVVSMHPNLHKTTWGRKGFIWFIDHY